MVEPAGADRDVHLGGPPHSSRRIAVLQLILYLRAVGAREGNDVGIHGRPVRVAGGSALIAAPAHVGSRVGKHHGVRLQPPYESEDAGPIVRLTLPVWAFAVRAIEPHLGD